MSKKNKQNPAQRNINFQRTINFVEKTAPVLTVDEWNWLQTQVKRGQFVMDYMIGPDVAALILEKHNPINRTINKAHVSSLARDMKNGDWMGHVGDEMTIDFNGNANNSQHRLGAVVESGTLQRFTIRFGVDPKTRLVEGRGRSKTQSDIMKMVHPELTNTTVRSSMNTIMHGFLGDSIRPSSFTRNVKPTNSELEMVSRKFGSDLYESFKFVTSKRVKAVTVEANAAVLHFLFKQSDHGHRADEFFEGLATGANLDIGDPRMVIRNRLLGDGLGKRELRSQRNRDATMGLIIKGWNAWIAGKTWSSREHTPETLIRIDGLTKLGNIPVYK